MTDTFGLFIVVVNDKPVYIADGYIYDSDEPTIFNSLEAAERALYAVQKHARFAIGELSDIHKDIPNVKTDIQIRRIDCTCVEIIQ